MDKMTESEKIRWMLEDKQCLKQLRDLKDHIIRHFNNAVDSMDDGIDGYCDMIKTITYLETKTQDHTITDVEIKKLAILIGRFNSIFGLSWEDIAKYTRFRADGKRYRIPKEIIRLYLCQEMPGWKHLKHGNRHNPEKKTNRHFSQKFIPINSKTARSVYTAWSERKAKIDGIKSSVKDLLSNLNDNSYRTWINGIIQVMKDNRHDIRLIKGLDKLTRKVAVIYQNRKTA